VNLNGALFESNGRTATMVSTDGHRLTKYSVAARGARAREGRDHHPAQGHGRDPQGAQPGRRPRAGLAVDGQHFFVHAGALLLSVKLNNVTFPPYQQVIPSSHKRRVTALRDELLGVLRRAEVMAPEKTATVRLEIGDGSLKLTADNPDLGVAHQEIEVDYAGDTLVAGFNARYLIEVLEVIDTPKIYLEFQNELDPCVIRPVEGPDFLGVVMPMRI
jgi:DNA polymerase-3 subunit beta